MGQAREGLLLALGPEQRIVVDGRQVRQGRVHAPHQGAQVVILPEEGVETALHLERRAVGEGVAPRPGASPEIGIAFDERDPDPALGEHGGGREPRETAARDDGGGARHAGRSARNECTMPRCQPSMGSVRTWRKPWRSKRRSKAPTPSKSSTLRRR